MRKRTLCCFLFVCLLMGLVGCGGQPTSVSSDDSGSEATGTADASPEEPIVEEILPDPAEGFVDGLTTAQQLEQMFFVRCPDVDAVTLVQEHAIGGYILFSRDFEGQTPDSLRETVQSYQQAAAIPLLLGVDEEGGSVVRISSNPAFRATRFRSPQVLYQEGGFDGIQQDTQEKDALLQELGLNVNLAPVCDLSTDPSDFIYSRAFGQEADPTSTYVQTVVGQMTQDRIGAVLKHFPGYGNNADTHTGIAIDERPLETFRANDFKPFQAGITAGAGAVMVSHNVVKAMDDTMPASLSPAVHQILREELGFSGVIMTDDLMMEAITEYTDGADAAVLAVQAGNDMLISSDFAAQYNAILAAVEAGTIAPAQIRESAMRVIRWKMQIGLLPETITDTAVPQSTGGTQPNRITRPRTPILPGSVTRSRNAIQSDDTTPSGSVVAPDDATPSRSAVTPDDATPSRNAVTPDDATPSGSAVAPDGATPSGSAVAPDGATPSGSAVTPDGATPSGSAVTPDGATPSGSAVAPDDATPSGSAVTPDDATPSRSAVTSDGGTSSKVRKSINTGGTSTGGTKHRTRRRSRR